MKRAYCPWAVRGLDCFIFQNVRLVIKKMAKVLGLDIGKDFCVACLLESKPTEPRQFYREAKFVEVKPSSTGISKLLELRPDIVVMEPTGTNYQRLWGDRLAEAGVEVWLVHNDRLPAYRTALDLPDKDDAADALALACYYFDYYNSPKRFVAVRDRTVARIREIVLRLGHYNRVKSPIVNRLRQDLAWQFPEVQNKRGDRDCFGEPPVFWRWLAGKATYKTYDREYEKTVGKGLQQELRFAAAILCEYMRQEKLLELELQNLIESDRRFEPYLKVFSKFGLGLRLSCLFLSQIYPLQTYLGLDGKPEVKIYKGKNSGKPTKHYLSLRRFKKALGVAPIREQSGISKNSTKKSGSALCRQGFWQLVFCRYEVRRARPKNEIGEKIGGLIDDLKASKCPIKKLRSKVSAKIAELLFKELVKELAINN